MVLNAIMIPACKYKYSYDFVSIASHAKCCRLINRSCSGKIWKALYSKRYSSYCLDLDILRYYDAAWNQLSMHLLDLNIDPHSSNVKQFAHTVSSLWTKWKKALFTMKILRGQNFPASKINFIKYINIVKVCNQGLFSKLDFKGECKIGCNSERHIRLNLETASST